MCSAPSNGSDPSNGYPLLGLTQVMDSISTDPSNDFLAQVMHPVESQYQDDSFENETTQYQDDSFSKELIL